MYLSTSSRDCEPGGTAPGEFHPMRAGLRVPPPGVQPDGLFVVVEMAVLVLVVALAMVAIIVSSSGPDGDVRAEALPVDARVIPVRAADPGSLGDRSARAGDRGNVSVTAR